MAKKKELLSEDTIIVFGKIPVSEYRKFFIQSIGEGITAGVEGMNFQTWLFTQGGKTLKEVTEEYFHPLGHKTMDEFLTERRFNTVSEQDKDFIMAFDKEINELGYDFGGAIHAGHSWGSQQMIIYGKTGTKSRQCAVRIWIKNEGILFQIYFTKIDAHRQYIETAPTYIKEVFTGYNNNNICKSCRGKCGPKEYTIDGHFYSICRDAPFWFDKPSIEKLPDYMGLLNEFYPKSKRKTI